MVRPGGGTVLPARASAPRWVPRTEASSVAAAVTATVGFRARKGTQLIYVVVRRLYTPFFCLFLVSCFFFFSLSFSLRISFNSSTCSTIYSSAWAALYFSVRGGSYFSSLPVDVVSAGSVAPVGAVTQVPVRRTARRPPAMEGFWPRFGRRRRRRPRACVCVGSVPQLGGSRKLVM